MQHIIEALVKDLAEQLRPMVADMVRQEMAEVESKLLAVTGSQLADVAERIDLEELAKHIDVSTLAGELTDSQLTEIAGDIDLTDLASEIDPDKLTENLDIDEAIRDFFQNNSFSIRA
jgi:DMSO/TMAO reductase YedYZ molybdopterin-dependent catalytic subunit